MAPTTPKQREDKDQRLVQTPYGRGLIIRTRRPTTSGPTVYEVRLLEWENAAAKDSSRSQHPVLYTTTELPTVPPKVGDDVICTYGRGRVTAIVPVIIRKKAKTTPEDELREVEEDKKDDSEVMPYSGESEPTTEKRFDKYAVTLTCWRLANRSTVKLYLTAPPAVVRKKTLYEMNAFEKVSFAQDRKALASTQFRQKNYKESLNLYASAVDAVRYVQHDSHSTNELRADLVEVMVTCSNNAATCSAQLGQWNEATRFAKNALVLLDALHGKRGMKIHTILNQDGLADEKLFGEWRVKSYLVMARAEMEKGSLDVAVECLKKGLEIVSVYNVTVETRKVSLGHLAAQEREIRRLMATCAQRRKAEKKKEKARAQAMFGGGGSRVKNESASSSPPSSAVPVGGDDSPTTPPAQAVPNVQKLNGPKEAKLPSPSAPSLGLNMRDFDDDEELEELDATTPPSSVAAKVTKPGSLINGSPKSPKSLKRKVSFSGVDDVRKYDTDGDSEEEDMEEPWYEEHKEALILAGAAGFMWLTVLLLRGGGTRR